MRPRRDPDLLSTAQAAAVLGVSKRTVIRMVAAGELPVAFTTPAGHARIRRRDLDALLNGVPWRQDDAA